MTEYMIRDATAADLPAVLSLYSQPDMDDGGVLDLKTAKAILARMHRYPNYRLFVACSGDRIVGTYTLAILDNLVHQGAPSALIEATVVLAERRGQGVGTAMMNHAMELCRESKCYKLALSSNLIREPAHKIYEGLGFRRHGLSFMVNLGE